MRLLKYSAFVLIAVFAIGTDAANAADVQKGRALFQHCVICHNTEKNAGNGLGPNLFGVAGRKAASLPDFAYSPALRKSGIVWRDDKLAAWIKAPARLVPGSKMVFPGLADPRQVDDLVAYLDTLK